jgi:hypothetical protein
VSPKSRGRPQGRGKPKKSGGGPVRPLTAVDRAIADAEHLEDEDSRLTAEVTASAWLGDAWVKSSELERDPESKLIAGVVGRAQSRPSPRIYNALHALRLIAPAGDVSAIDDAIAALSGHSPEPGWVGTEPPVPVAAYIASDPWGADQMLLIEYGGDEPHGLLAHVTYPGGTALEEIAILDPGAAERWDELTHDEPIPMPLVSHSIREVFVKLAQALRQTDMYWPKHDDPEYVELRSLVAARCAVAGLTEDEGWPEWEGISESDRASLLHDFVRASGLPDDTVTRSVADSCIDYGDGYIGAGVLAWSPDEVALFLTDYLPRKVLLDSEQRAAVPSVTKAWVQFALARAGVEQRWIDPVAEVVDQLAEQFFEEYDDDATWGPSKQIVADLIARGVDVTDKEQLETAISEYNAEQLARRMLEE